MPTRSSAHTHMISLFHTRSLQPTVSRWLWGHEVPSDSISTKVIPSLQRRITRPSSAFLLKHNSPLFGILTSYLQSPPHSPLLTVFFLSTWPKHGHNNFILFFSLAPMHNIQPFPRYSLLNVFFCPPLPFFFLFSDFQGQTGQTMPLVSVWMGLATHHHCRGRLGNSLTINFQLKQTKRWQLRVHGRCQEAVLIYDKWA